MTTESNCMDAASNTSAAFNHIAPCLTACIPTWMKPSFPHLTMSIPLLRTGNLQRTQGLGQLTCWISVLYFAILSVDIFTCFCTALSNILNPMITPKPRLVSRLRRRSQALGALLFTQSCLVQLFPPERLFYLSLQLINKSICRYKAFNSINQLIRERSLCTVVTTNTKLPQRHPTGI